MKFVSKLFIALMLIGTVSCENEEYNDIYGRPVDFRVNIDFLDKDLTASLSTKSFTVPRAGSPYLGFGGLLVVRSVYPREGYGNLLDLYAFDLACPFEKRQDFHVEATTDGKAKCEHCGSVFNLLGGKHNLVSGPSKESLVTYPVYYRPNEQGTVFHILSKY